MSDQTGRLGDLLIDLELTHAQDHLATGALGGLRRWRTGDAGLQDAAEIARCLRCARGADTRIPLADDATVLPVDIEIERQIDQQVGASPALTSLSRIATMPCEFRLRT